MLLRLYLPNLLSRSQLRRSKNDQNMQIAKQKQKQSIEDKCSLHTHIFQFYFSNSVSDQNSKFIEIALKMCPNQRTQIR